MKNNLKRTADGFTLIETIVSLLIISLIVFTFIFAIQTVLKSSSKTKKTLFNSLEILKVDRQIREFVTSVEVAFCNGELNLSYNENTISIKTSFSEFKLHISQKIKITEVSYIYSKVNKPIGLNVKYKIYNKDFECSEIFKTFESGAFIL